MTIETKRRAMQTIEIIRQSRPSLRAAFRDVAAALGVSWQTVYGWYCLYRRGAL